ncbi:MAG TPA: thiosulfate oxidation carrier protein SoxY [Burkholderiales bacterium]|nr:thiosulfate oxidation carrier protein SoxY [Burkholderiales bacterium]
MARCSRRRFLAAAAAGVVAAHVRVAGAQLAAQPLEPLIAKLTGDASVQPGRVTLEIPRLADNGHSVPLKVRVESAMTERDYVKTIHILSGRNPRPHIAAFHLNPHCGRAEISTRVRLNGTQRLVVLAQASDGSWWSGSAEVEVTETACLDAT